MELSRPPDKSTEALRELDGWYSREYATIMNSEALRPDAKQRHIEELRREYAERRTLAADAAKRDLQEWDEIFQSRAESARQPKMPEDKDAPLPAPQPGFEVRKVGENADGSLVLQLVQKPPYAERSGKWQR